MNKQTQGDDTAKASDTAQKPKGKTSSKTPRPTIKSLQKEIDTLKGELTETKDRMLRQAAEFDNFRKRKQKEEMEWMRTARESVIRDLLPVLDDFERMLLNGIPGNEAQTKGVELIREKLMGILEGKGLSQMESLGKRFDPDYHDALLTVERDDVEPGIVVDVHENGYLMHDRVLRHAKVIVSKAPVKETEQESGGEDTTESTEKQIDG
jgi:molecular chaperone GrpE